MRNIFELFFRIRFSLIFDNAQQRQFFFICDATQNVYCHNV